MTYKTEFPDYPENDMPRVPIGFDDVSWHNDAMPRFENEALGLTLWVDYRDPEQRETPDGKRFLLVNTEHDTSDVELEESDDMADIESAIEAHCVSNFGGHTDTGRGVCAHCAKLMM